MDRNVSVKNCTWSYPYYAENTLQNYVIFGVFILIFLCGLFGNLMLIAIIIINRRMRTLPNFLIANLAVGDTIFLVAHILSTLPMYVLSTFHADISLCKLNHFTRQYTVGISMFTLMFLAIDRLVEGFFLGERIVFYICTFFGRFALV